MKISKGGGREGGRGGREGGEGGRITLSTSIIIATKINNIFGLTSTMSSARMGKQSGTSRVEDCCFGVEGEGEAS